MPSRQVVAARQVHVQTTAASGHAVKFYESDSALIEALAQQIGPALQAGDTAIVVATKTHRDGLVEELRVRGMDVTTAAQAGRYIELDAAETLAKFTVDGWPDAQKFMDVIGDLVARAEARTGHGRRLVIFGEMVALLWAEGRQQATVRLEELWNDLAQRHSFFLLCGYAIDAFDRLEHRQLFFNICGEHSQIHPAESYPEQGSEKQRRRSVARLQQKARALETEMRLSQERILLLQGATNAGSWELDLVNDTFSFSSAAARLLGSPTGRFPLSQLLDCMYYSGDRDMVSGALQQAQRGRRKFAATFRVRRGDATRILEIRGKTFYNAGYPIMLGILSDVTPAETLVFPQTAVQSRKKRRIEAS